MSRSAEEATDIGNCRIDREKRVHIKTKAKKPKQNYLSFENRWHILENSYKKHLLSEHDAMAYFRVFASQEREKEKSLLL